MSWRVAKSLLVLLKQVNEEVPNRDRGSDGTIGDENHASRSSDHNPWVDGNVVTALDITHDPRHGVDSYKMADALVASRDPRIKYVISNHRIASSTVHPWQWRPYSGANPHDHHVHVSVEDKRELYDSEKPWNYGKLTPDPGAKPGDKRPTVRIGSTGADVKYLQTLLGLKSDGVFGVVTRSAVVTFQTHSGLVPDGVVGPMTWDALVAKGAPTT